MTKTINDLQRSAHFEFTTSDTDKDKLLVVMNDRSLVLSSTFVVQDLLKDNSFWSHLSIYCVQNRLFSMQEVVGNLVVTDL